MYMYMHMYMYMYMPLGFVTHREPHARVGEVEGLEGRVRCDEGANHLARDAPKVTLEARRRHVDELAVALGAGALGSVESRHLADAYTCTCVCACIAMHACAPMGMDTYTCMYPCVHVFMWMCIHAYVHMHMHMRTCTCAHAHAHASALGAVESMHMHMHLLWGPLRACTCICSGGR